MRNVYSILFLILISCVLYFVVRDTPNEHEKYSINIGSDEVGIKVSRSGEKPLDKLNEGVYDVEACDTIFIYNIDKQQIKESFEASSRDSLKFMVSLEITYQLKADSIIKIHDNYGTGLESRYIIPQSRRIIRGFIAQYKKDDLDSMMRRMNQKFEKHFYDILVIKELGLNQ